MAEVGVPLPRCKIWETSKFYFLSLQTLTLPALGSWAGPERRHAERERTETSFPAKELDTRVKLSWTLQTISTYELNTAE